MASETVEQVCADVAERTVVARLLGEDSMIHNSSVASLLHDINKRFLAAHKSDTEELRSQVRIAKDAFFKIAQRKHSREVHDIVCEAEFMMNHPECRNEVANG